MDNTTMWVTKKLRDDLLMIRIKEGKQTLEEVIRMLIEQYEKGGK